MINKILTVVALIIILCSCQVTNEVQKQYQYESMTDREVADIKKTQEYLSQMRKLRLKALARQAMLKTESDLKSK